MSDTMIFGRTFEEIEAMQQRRRIGKPIDVSKPAKPEATQADVDLLEKHGADGLREMGFFGVLDRLNLL